MAEENRQLYFEIGEEYIGLYQKWDKIPYENEKGAIYRNMSQSIVIKKDGYRNFTTAINTVTANGNTCSYTGKGRWYKSKDRFEFSNSSEVDGDPDALCKLSIIVKNSSAYVITQTAGCQIYCGVRNSLDGWIIKKSP